MTPISPPVLKDMRGDHLPAFLGTGRSNCVRPVPLIAGIAKVSGPLGSWCTKHRPPFVVVARNGGSSQSRTFGKKNTTTRTKEWLGRSSPGPLKSKRDPIG